MPKTIYFSFLFITSLICFSCNEVTNASKFNGLWKLYTYEVLDKGIWQTDSARIGHNGFILYDGQGHMSVQILPYNFNSYVMDKGMDSLSNKEIKGLADHYNSNYVYFANYVVHENIVEHIILSCTEPAYIGMTLKREFEFRGDTLILTPVMTESKKFRLKWIKQK